MLFISGSSLRGNGGGDERDAVAKKIPFADCSFTLFTRMTNDTMLSKQAKIHFPCRDPSRVWRAHTQIVFRGFYSAAKIEIINYSLERWNISQNNSSTFFDTEIRLVCGSGCGIHKALGGVSAKGCVECTRHMHSAATTNGVKGRYRDHSILEPLKFRSSSRTSIATR